MMTKSIFIFLSTLSFLVCDICAQNKQTYSAALYFGAFFPGSNFTYVPEIGMNISLDAETRRDNFGFYINGTYNFGKQQEPTIELHEYTTKPERKNVSVLEFYGGPRWYIGPYSKINGLFDVGLGYYNVSTIGFESNSSFGFNIGAGVNFPLAKTTVISFKMKYHAFTQDSYTAYGGAYLGLRYIFE
jgi:hypothetical protein